MPDRELLSPAGARMLRDRLIAEAGGYLRNTVGCGSSDGSEVVRFRSSGVAGVLVHNGAGVTAHRWLKVAFIPSHLVKATFSHNRRRAPVTTATADATVLM